MQAKLAALIGLVVGEQVWSSYKVIPVCSQREYLKPCLQDQESGLSPVYGRLAKRKQRMPIMQSSPEDLQVTQALQAGVHWSWIYLPAC